MQQSGLSEEEKDDLGEEKDNPGLSKVIERNIRTIIRLRLKAASKRNLQERIADTITAFSGHIVFVYVHIVWFGVWIVLNTGWLGVRPFDPFPYSDLAPNRISLGLVKNSAIKLHKFYWLFSVK